MDKLQLFGVKTA